MCCFNRPAFSVPAAVRWILDFLIFYQNFQHSTEAERREFWVHLKCVFNYSNFIFYWIILILSELSLGENIQMSVEKCWKITQTWEFLCVDAWNWFSIFHEWASSRRESVFLEATQNFKRTLIYQSKHFRAYFLCWFCEIVEKMKSGKNNKSNWLQLRRSL